MVRFVSRTSNRTSSGHVLTLAKLGVVLGALVLLFIAHHGISGRIFPNIWSLGVNIGESTVNEASQSLVDAWNNTVKIQLTVDGRGWTATPSDLGFILEPIDTVNRARNVGLAGIPFGYNVSPTVTVERETADAFLRHLAFQVDVSADEAGYAWQGDQLTVEAGRDGVQLDVPATLDRLVQRSADVVQARRLELSVAAVKPADPMRYLQDAELIASRPFEIRGYDPFDDEMFIWSTNRATLTSWLSAGNDRLTLRISAFKSFVQEKNAGLNNSQFVRYLDEDEAISAVESAITARQTFAFVRIRHQPTSYTVAYGDSGYLIARKSGIPYYLLEKANPGRDLAVLAPGDVLNIPSPDPMVPLKPVAEKRIVVNLDNQTLVAFEKGAEVFRWQISSGIEDAPTSPGVFQILGHEPLAVGSGYALCGNDECGEWRMNWFMGIYEAVPGLINGFHGAVLLPNGGYLGGRSVGRPFTFGCVMSRDEDAKRLYDWADEGTIVEIISAEYAPRSQLARSVT